MNPSTVSNASLRTENLTKRFGKRSSVDNLNLSIYPGELYALLGDNGAGKTTTIGMLTTLLAPTSGTFYICGYNGLTQARQIRGLFGVVSQDVSIYNELTVFENLKFLAELYGLKKTEIEARIVELLNYAGLMERVNDRACDLSGGMQRRLAIACAMVNRPKVLFMDEPTVGLDPASRRQIWAALKGLKKMGVTILLTTHYLEEAELLADRIGIIRDGKLLVEGTVQELAKKIQGMRGLSVRLTDEASVDDPGFKEKVERFTSRFGTTYRIDSLRNTLYMSQPDSVKMEEFLRMVLDFMSREEIPFNKFASGEPNLEDVFLAVSKEEGREPLAAPGSLNA